MLDNQLIDQFCQSFTSQGGMVHLSKNVEEAAVLVNMIIQNCAAGAVCCAPFVIRGVRFDMLVASSIPFEKIIAGNALTALGKLDVAITLSYGAITQTGSLIEVSNNDDERLLSSLSRIHISVVEESRILENLSDFASLVRSLLSITGKKPNITLIGGPSRTSDIELKSVLGVHGPHEVHAVILKE